MVTTWYNTVKIRYACMSMKLYLNVSEFGYVSVTLVRVRFLYIVSTVINISTYLGWDSKCSPLVQEEWLFPFLPLHPVSSIPWAQNPILRLQSYVCLLENVFIQWSLQSGKGAEDWMSVYLLVHPTEDSGPYV